MALKGSLLYWEEPATGFSPEPDESGPYPHALFLLDPHLYYSPIYAFLSHEVSSLQVFRSQIFVCAYSIVTMHATCPTHPIFINLLTLTKSGEEYKL